ncbi:hypothetical protein VTN77DRAFT_7707 [Rasamsonia byssochlamydoides]|uniref:uncharacterized protein n=1 Tax=Rasamsonia byssochlamydoides TaxID=89139 RepID=UPI0037434633
MMSLLQRRAARLFWLAHPRRTGSLTNNKLTISQIRRQTTSAVDAHGVQETDVFSDPPRLRSSRREALKAAKSFSEFLTDTFHRQHDYLRISITERCNLRCLYCMPEEGVPLSSPAHLLTTPEIVYLSTLFVSQGVTKIRLTGGEPTVRKDIIPLMQAIGDLRRDGLRELCLTTNGISLHRKLDAMAEAGLTGVNLSLDTLDPFQFQIMTRRKGLDAVMKSIDRILEMNKLGAGIKLKINCVVMRGLNDREIIPFVELGREKPIEVRFIEYMPFDGNKWSQGKMVSYQEMLAVIREKYPALEKVPDQKNDTSKTYRVPGFEGRVGFITSMTDNFCGTCNRLRITSDGNLKVCLHGNAEVSLRDLIRKANNGQPIDHETMKSLNLLESARKAAQIHEQGGIVNERERELLNVIGLAVKRKKAKHAGMGELEKMKNRPMILIDEMPGPVSKISHVNSFVRGARPVSPFLRIPVHILPAATAFAQIRAYNTRSDWKNSSSDRKNSTTRPARNDTTRPERNRQSTLSLPSRAHPDLPHLTPVQTVHMTNIDGKPITRRIATAQCSVFFSNTKPYELIASGNIEKGNVFSVARTAGIMAVKKTADIVPLCHPGIGITGVEVNLRLRHPTLARGGKPRPRLGAVQIRATVTCVGRTGVEMEAMMAVMGAALTVYDMCKAVDKGIVIGNASVIEKMGGKSGHWVYGQKQDAGDYNKNNNNQQERPTKEQMLAKKDTVPRNYINKPKRPTDEKILVKERPAKENTLVKKDTVPRNYNNKKQERPNKENTPVDRVLDANTNLDNNTRPEARPRSGRVRVRVRGSGRGAGAIQTLRDFVRELKQKHEKQEQEEQQEENEKGNEKEKNQTTKGKEEEGTHKIKIKAKAKAV